jgi:hypothetical protein
LAHTSDSARVLVCANARMRTATYPRQYGGVRGVMESEDGQRGSMLWLICNLA